MNKLYSMPESDMCWGKNRARKRGSGPWDRADTTNWGGQGESFEQT